MQAPKPITVAEAKMMTKEEKEDYMLHLRLYRMRQHQLKTRKKPHEGIIVPKNNYSGYESNKAMGTRKERRGRTHRRNKTRRFSRSK